MKRAGGKRRYPRLFCGCAHKANDGGLARDDGLMQRKGVDKNSNLDCFNW